MTGGESSCASVPVFVVLLLVPHAVPLGPFLLRLFLHLAFVLALVLLSVVYPGLWVVHWVLTQLQQPPQYRFSAWEVGPGLQNPQRRRWHRRGGGSWEGTQQRAPAVHLGANQGLLPY